MAYLFADKTEYEKIKNTEADNLFGRELSKIIKIFYKGKQLSELGEKKIYSQEIFKKFYDLPWMNDFEGFYEPYMLANYYDVKIWNGDGFLNINPYNKNWELININIIFNDELTIIPETIITLTEHKHTQKMDKKHIYVPTKFSSKSKDHIFGGIIKYNKLDDKAIIYIYNDKNYISAALVPFDIIVKSLLILANNFGFFGSETSTDVIKLFY